MKRLLLALLTSTALAAPAMAATVTVDFDCSVDKVVDRREFISKPTFWAATRSIKPEYRRITTFEDGDGQKLLTYGLGDGKPQNWTMPITHVGKTAGDKDGIEAKTAQPDQWGHSRWVYFNFDDRDRTVHFWTTILYPDKTVSASIGTCEFTTESKDKLSSMPDKKPEQPTLREPAPAPSNKTWTVPIERRHGGIELEGALNDTVPVHWALDTGASITNVPYDLAVQLNARVLREDVFEQADGTTVRNQVILIKKLAIGGMVAVDNVEASVTARGTQPLLGKNFLDSFSSYEVNNALSQLILHK